LLQEKDIIARSNPDLFYNRAIVSISINRNFKRSMKPAHLFQAFKYQEDYNLALRSFESAMALDPLWETPRIKRDELLQYLKNVQNSINNNGYMKTKRLYQLIRVFITRK